MSDFQRAAVIGSGAWGTTLAIILARNGVATTLVVRTEDEAKRLNSARENGARLPGFTFPVSLAVQAEPGGLAGAELVVFAVPAQVLDREARTLAPAMPSDAVLLSASKGIELDTGRRMSEVLAAVLPGRPLAALSGPNLSREVARGLPAATVIASANAPLDALREAFHTATFRVYTSDDIVGVELGGALKNIIAIAGGMVDAYGYGDNAKAGIITRGLAEISRLGVAAGANPMTFLGLAGIGDLVASAYSPLSRNRRLGELVAHGVALPEALRAIGEIAEGAATTSAALRLAKHLDVELPIAARLHAILYEGEQPAAAIEALLDRAPKPERL